MSIYKLIRAGDLDAIRAFLADAPSHTLGSAIQSAAAAARAFIADAAAREKVFAIFSNLQDFEGDE